MTTRTIQTRGAEIVLDDTGEAEPALIFLHYWGGSARTWSPVVARLPDGARKVAINQRGWGGSRATDGAYDLQALGDDVMDIVETLGIGRYVLVGHSMGGKVAQILAGRRARGLLGLVLVAPAPPTPMQVPSDVRTSMLASYQSREGVIAALKVLAGPTLGDAQREQVIEDTLRGDPDAKRSWPESGMLVDISGALAGLDLPVEIVLAEHDQVERETVLRPLFSNHLPGATITTDPVAGHLVPLEAPQAVAAACARLLARLH
ncbi:alpha/beta fold hydrolase [Lichenifustis flavocetrariae]|uniref:Alpha/beta hydrolase n=1 Tax=Lichenifustis flavocetrariae TaxID=2949735 RepID=A0AA41YZL4_9HYPH|nr:alpha/beta hydrolase [Lichenifustis flavocetrariae]MCW6507808.1 alpha/beta hydrolase [Lichenifustis flavocetrariae]